MRLQVVAFPFVSARIPGAGEVDVVLDTGAPSSVLDDSVAEELGLEIRSYWFPRGHRFTRGTQYSRRYVRVERLELGGIAVGPLELPLADIEEGTGLAGELILGCEVLRQCRILFGGRPGEVLFLAPRAPEELDTALRSLHPERAFVPLDLRWIDSHPHLEVSHGDGPPAQILLDSGALQSCVSAEMIAGWDLELEPFESGEGGSGQCFVDGLELGPWRIRMVAPVRAFFPSGALGFDVLSELTFLWDGPGNKLWIAGPRDGEPDTLAAGWFIDSYPRGRGVDPER